MMFIEANIIFLSFNNIVVKNKVLGRMISSLTTHPYLTYHYYWLSKDV